LVIFQKIGKKERKNNLIYDETTNVFHFSQKWQNIRSRFFLQPVRRNNMQLGGISFFSFGGQSGGVGFLLFSLCSHQVPNVFPKMFPIVLHPISFALNSTCNYISSPKEEIPTYLFWGCLKFDHRPIKDNNYKGKKNSTLVISTTNEYELPQDTTKFTYT